jgi:hypothetical protein
VTGIITGIERKKLKIEGPHGQPKGRDKLQALFTSCVAGMCGPSNLEFNHPKKFVK